MLFWILMLVAILILIFNPFGDNYGFFSKGIFFQYKKIKKEEKENRAYNQQLIQRYANNRYLYEQYKRKEHFTKKEILNKIIDFEQISFYLFINLCLSVILTLLVSVIMFLSCPVKEYNYSFEIKSLKDNMVTSGEFYRGHKNTYGFSGYINGEIKYYFLREMDHGDKIGYIPADKTYIYYDNDAKPQITVFTEYYDPEPWKEKWFWLMTDTEKIVKHYVLTVPENTILMNDLYQIDME